MAKKKNQKDIETVSGTPLLKVDELKPSPELPPLTGKEPMETSVSMETPSRQKTLRRLTRIEDHPIIARTKFRFNKSDELEDKEAIGSVVLRVPSSYQTIMVTEALTFAVKKFRKRLKDGGSEAFCVVIDNGDPFFIGLVNTDEGFDVVGEAEFTKDTLWTFFDDLGTGTWAGDLYGFIFEEPGDDDLDVRDVFYVTALYEYR